VNVKDKEEVRNMNKEQWRNLYHSYRWMKRFCTVMETLAWIGCHSGPDRYVVERVVL